MRRAGRRGQRGNTLIESTLTLVLLLMLLFGIVAFGRAVWAFGWVSHAAREGSRWAAVRGAQSGRPAAASDVATYVQGEVAGLDPSELVVNTTWPTNNNSGSYVKVNVQYTITQLVPWVPQMTVQSTSELMISQ